MEKDKDITSMKNITFGINNKFQVINCTFQVIEEVYKSYQESGLEYGIDYATNPKRFVWKNIKT